MSILKNPLHFIDFCLTAWTKKPKLFCNEKGSGSFPDDGGGYVPPARRRTIRNRQDLADEAGASCKVR